MHVLLAKHPETETVHVVDARHPAVDWVDPACHSRERRFQPEEAEPVPVDEAAEAVTCGNCAGLDRLEVGVA